MYFIYSQLFLCLELLVFFFCVLLPTNIHTNFLCRFLRTRSIFYIYTYIPQKRNIYKRQQQQLLYRSCSIHNVDEKQNTSSKRIQHKLNNIKTASGGFAYRKGERMSRGNLIIYTFNKVKCTQKKTTQKLEKSKIEIK